MPEAGGLKADPASHRAYVKGRTGRWTEVALTPKEFRVLCLLLERGSCGRLDLLQAAWDKEPGAVNPEAVDRCVGSLRRKLGPPGKAIKTLRGRGYTLG